LAHIPIPVVSTGTVVDDGLLSLNSGIFIWQIPQLASNAVATLTFNMEPTQEGQILNYVVITNYSQIKQDTNQANNEARVFTNVVIPP